MSMRFADFFKISFKHAVYCRPFSVLLSHHPSFSLAHGLYFISYVYLTLHKYVLLQCLGMGLHQLALFFLAFVDTVNLLTHFVAITVISYHVVMYLSHHLSSHFLCEKIVNVKTDTFSHDAISRQTLLSDVD